MRERSWIGRLLAALLIRGPEAPFILRDLDDCFSDDLARGLSPADARRRDLGNILASAASIWSNALRSAADCRLMVIVRAQAECHASSEAVSSAVS